MKARALFLFMVAAPSVASAQPLDPARPGRVAIGLSFGLGSASLESAEALRQLALRTVESQGLAVTDSGDLGFALEGHVTVRFYAPYYLLAQVGFDTVWSWTSFDWDGSAAGVPISGSVETDALLMEVPILFGGFLPFAKHFYALLAAGPSILAYEALHWKGTGDSTDEPESLFGDVGVGFQLLAGFDAMLSETAAVGLELRYRSARAEGLHDEDGATLRFADPAGGTTSSADQDLDFGGLSAALGLRVVI